MKNTPPTDKSREVVDEIAPLDVVNGSSLTTAGFNESLLKLQADL